MADVEVQTFEGRSDWLSARRGSLGGSDIPALFGYGFDSQLSLWVKKRRELEGEAEPEEWNLRYAVGHAVEPVLAEQAERDLGKAVIRLDPPVMYRIAGVPRFHVTPDALVLGKRPGKVHRRTLHKRAEALSSFKSWAVAGTEWQEGEVHPYALIQAQAEMLVTGLLQSYVTVLFGLGKSQTLPVEFHASFGGAILERLAAFWDAIERDVPPAPSGTDADDAALKALYPQSRPTRVFLSEDWAPKLQQIRDLGDQISKLEAQQEALKQSAKMEMGEADEAIIPGSDFAFRWRSERAVIPPSEGKVIDKRPFRIVKTPKEVIS